MLSVAAALHGNVHSQSLQGCDVVLQSTAARWDAQRRADADAAVQQALHNWQALQQELQHLHMEQRLQQQQQQQLQEYEEQWLQEQQQEQEYEQQYEQDWQQLSHHPDDRLQRQ